MAPWLSPVTTSLQTPLDEGVGASGRNENPSSSRRVSLTGASGPADPLEKE